MRKRKYLIAVLLLVVAGVGFAWVKDEYFYEPGVTVRNFRRLHVGMKEQDIEAILGQPGEDYEHFLDDRTEDYQRSRPAKRWTGKDCVVELDISYFAHPRYAELTVVRAYCGTCKLNSGSQIELAECPEPFLDRLRRWVGW